MYLEICCLALSGLGDCLRALGDCLRAFGDCLKDLESDGQKNNQALWVTFSPPFFVVGTGVYAHSLL